jgi:hypothetical protein
MTSGMLPSGKVGGQMTIMVLPPGRGSYLAAHQDQGNAAAHAGGHHHLSGSEWLEYLLLWYSIVSALSFVTSRHQRHTAASATKESA